MYAEGNWFIIFVFSVSGLGVSIKLLQAAATRFRVVPSWRVARGRTGAMQAQAFTDQLGERLPRLPNPITDRFCVPRLSIYTRAEARDLEEGTADKPQEHIVGINQGTGRIFGSREAELFDEPSFPSCTEGSAVRVVEGVELPLIATRELSPCGWTDEAIENKSDLLTTSQNFDDPDVNSDSNVVPLAASGGYYSWDDDIGRRKRGRDWLYPVFNLGTGRPQWNRGRHAWRGDRETRGWSNNWPSRTALEEPFSWLGAQPSWPRMFSKRSFMEEERTLPEPVRFKLTGSCKLVLQQGDITEWHVDGQTDAIVNAANEQMLGGGGVDGAIHRAAGPELFEACEELPEISDSVRCPVGEAVVTPGFKLPVAQIIHTVGPVYSSDEESAALLENAYKNSLSLARRQGVKYIAFPAISCGTFGYPAIEAAKIALKTVKDHADGLVEVHFLLFEASVCKAWLDEAQESLQKLDK